MSENTKIPRDVKTSLKTLGDTNLVWGYSYKKISNEKESKRQALEEELKKEAEKRRMLLEKEILAEEERREAEKNKAEEQTSEDESKDESE